MIFRMEDLRIDTFRVGDSITGSGPTGYRFTHIPTGESVRRAGAPLLSQADKLAMVEELKEKIRKRESK